MVSAHCEGGYVNGHLIGLIISDLRAILHSSRASCYRSLTCLNGYQLQFGSTCTFQMCWNLGIAASRLKEISVAFDELGDLV